jgi:hypothetical protein
MFEETTAASQSLTRLAESLNDAVRRFETGTSPGGAVVDLRRAGDGPASRPNDAEAPSRPVKAAATGSESARAVTTVQEDGWEEF